jgi:diadenylate cyclase
MLLDLANSAFAMIKSIRIPDILDMAIIALMIFALLTWFKTRASRFVLIGIILLGGVYMAARFFQLYLTTIVLQGFFAISLFVLVVIFQEDLRGFFERLALLGNIGKKNTPLSDLEKMAGIIAQTASNLAKKRIGALIVLTGSDPLARHINGGIIVDGLVSEPLLESIFDPHSIGHDGAVIISGTRIKMFGCHLPLSMDTAKYGNIGLRHTAALGLAQRVDALSIVISEEKGTISVGQSETLTTIPNAAALHEAVEQFYIRNSPTPESHPAFKWVKENTREKIIALGLACILWVTFGYQRDIVRRDFNIPIEYKNIPKNWQLNKPQAADVIVILQGPQQAFYLLDEKSLKLSLDLSPLALKKNEFTLNKTMINAPSNLSVTEINPAKIYINASKLVALTLPVNIKTLNSLPGNVSLQKINFNPAHLRVLVDSKINPEQINIETEPIDLQKIYFTTSFATKIVLPSGVYLPDGKTATVHVTIRVKKKSAS